MQVYDSGVDWLTLSFPAGNEHLDRAMRRSELALQALSGGMENIKESCWQGYAGFQSYGYFSGIREDGLIIRASGREAKLAEKICREESWDARCTRLDLQVTCKVDREADDFGERVQSQVAAAEAAIPKQRQKNLAAYKVRGASSGGTIGSRTSERYSRFYDKTAEQRGKVEPGLWRFEVEFKGQQARLMYKMLMQAASGRWLALSVVKTTFELHGVDMGWIGASEPLELPSTYRQNDDERRLNWLKSHVSKTVAELIERGHKEQVLEALGLTKDG